MLQPHLLRRLRSRSGSSGSGGCSGCPSARSSSGRLGCRCRRGSGRSRSHGPSTRRCSGSGPPRRPYSGTGRGSAPSRRRSDPGLGARTFIHSGRRVDRRREARSPSSVSLATGSDLPWTGWFQSPCPSSAGSSSRVSVKDLGERGERRPRISSTVTGRPSSRAIVVNAASSSPQAVIHSVNGAGSRSMFSAKPCVVTHLGDVDPDGGDLSRRPYPDACQAVDSAAATPKSARVRMTVPSRSRQYFDVSAVPRQIQDRIADELPGA